MAGLKIANCVVYGTEVGGLCAYTGQCSQCSLHPGLHLEGARESEQGKVVEIIPSPPPFFLRIAWALSMLSPGEMEENTFWDTWFSTM